jgi:hypothetical protein
MPSSYADYVQDWESLVAAVQENASLLPNVDIHLEELTDAMDDLRQRKARQGLHAGARQKATQDLGDALEIGKEAAVKLRGFVKSKLGPKNELLVRFGMAPVRPRLRRVLKPPTPPPSTE